MDVDTISGWFSLSNGKVYGRCPHCHSPRIAYYKDRRPGLTGISSMSRGITPACVDCGKNLPTQISKETRPSSLKINPKVSKKAF